MLLAFSAYRVWVPLLTMDVELSAKVNPTLRFTLYFKQDKGGFSESRTALLNPGITDEQGLLTFHARLESARPISAIRLDPNTGGGSIEIRSLTFRTAQGSSRLDAAALQRRILDLQDFEVVRKPSVSPPNSGHGFAVHIKGTDPYLVVSVPESVQTSVSTWQQKRWDFLRSWRLVVLGLLLCLLAQAKKLARITGAFKASLRRWSEQLSLLATVRVGSGATLILLALPLVFLVYVGMGLHNSSLGAWNDQFGYSLSEPRFERGEVQEIRSDEWYVYTPWLLNQIQTGMGSFNPNIGPDGATLVAGVPVVHPTLLAQPQFWGYLFLPLEQGFSWHWGFRAISLLGSVFILLLLLTRGQTSLAVAGSLAVFGSSQVQWWYASWLTEIITGMAGALIGVFLWANAKNPKSIYGAALLAALAGMHAVLQPYLPALLCLAYLGVFAGSAVVWESHDSGALKLQLNHRLWAILLGGLLFAALFLSYFATAKTAIHDILNTFYPGSRKLVGGDIAWSDFTVGFFDFWRNKYETPLPTNPSESSRPLLIFPFVAMAAIASHGRAKMGALFWSVLAYCVLAEVWMSVPLPLSVSHFFGSIGLEKIPTERMYSGLGVASWMLTVVAFSHFDGQRGPKNRDTLLLVLAAALAVLASWRFQQQFNPSYFTIERLLISTVVICSMVWAVCKSQRMVFLAAVLLAIYMPVQVNPISSGLGRLLDKELLHRTKTMDPLGQEKWVVFDNPRLSQAMRANGHEVISGEYFVPRFDLMHHFDPDEKNITWWNNYGTENFSASSDRTRIDFVRHAPPQLDGITLSPCNPTFKAIGVTRFVMNQKPDLRLLPCLKPLGEFTSIGVFVYGTEPATPTSGSALGR